MTPSRTPVPAVTAVLYYASAAIESYLVALAAAVVMTVSATVYQLAALSVTSTSALLVIPPGLSQVIFLIPAATALLSPILPLF